MPNTIMAAATGLLGLGLLSLGMQPSHASISGGVANNTVGEATVVWFGVTSEQGGGVSSPSRHIVYHRLWSDGRLEMRYAGTVNGCNIDTASCDWTLVPAEPSGSGHACRADIDGDHQIGVGDLLSVIDQWNDSVICEPTHACIDLGNVGSDAM
ncbi:MAG: hypothetical protein QF438_01090 [Phycisphaerales bacterium]|jgi:hypothetical protein|nr:hypothetical protein [Planctomycetaceae bacterium]MDP6157986.1 hypothetical protein [Phycisphaerales bacterium]MDP7086980.1 hypothetical protein [Phycisphaerales bacterium]MDP7189465.1 hypothetical protein [Phycisphaerales bacterium]MDP7518725.1 hypothetical protein [Phycisphaerales bacterium]|tara:strand:+ start:1700 stop:2161 length:462 start_codon:yes stop_codon:yes gene_type:complete